MNNIADAESSYQMGMIEWKKFMQDFYRDWYKPLYEVAMINFRESVPDDLPGIEEIDKVMDQMMGGRYGNGRLLPETKIPLPRASIPGRR